MPSLCPSKRPNFLRRSHCWLQWLCVAPERYVDWLARYLAAILSQWYDRGLSKSQSDFTSMQRRRLCLPSLCNRHSMEVRAHPTTSIANRFCVLLVKRDTFASYEQRYGKTGHPTNLENQIREPSYWWAKCNSNRILWRWFAGGSHFSIGRPYHWRLGRRLCLSKHFANRICLQLCLNRGQTPKSGRSQTDTMCVDDRSGVSRSDIHEHAVASGRRFHPRRRRHSLSGPVGRRASGTRFFLVDIRRHP